MNVALLIYSRLVLKCYILLFVGISLFHYNYGLFLGNIFRLFLSVLISCIVF